MADHRSHTVVLRGKSDTTFKTLQEAGRFFLEEYFPAWTKNRQVTFVPPVPWIAYKRNTSDGQRGDDAELLLYKTLHNYAKENREPMFAIVGFEYDRKNRSKKIDAILTTFFGDDSQKALKELPSKFEIDMIVIHCEIGILLIEVKSKSESKQVQNEWSDAVGSLNCTKTFIQHVLLRNTKLPIYKLAVFPNATNRDAISEERKLRDNVRAVFRNPISQKIEMDDLFKELKAETMLGQIPNKNQLDEILELLVSIKCLVSANIDRAAMVKVKLDDDAINLRKQIKETDSKIQKHEVFPKSDLKKNGLVQKLQGMEVLYLNPKQISIFSGPMRQLICGVAGTGKTILLWHKILKLAKDRQSQTENTTEIVYWATDAIAEKAEKFFLRNEVSESVTVLRHSTTREACRDRKYLANKFSSVHLFADESQNLPDFINIFEIIGLKKKQGTYFWVSLDPVQATDKVEMEAIEQLRVSADLEYVNPPLQYVMRCTPEVTNFWKKLLPERGLPVSISEGNRLFVGDIENEKAESAADAAEKILSLTRKLIDGENVTMEDCVVLIRDNSLVLPVRQELLRLQGMERMTPAERWMASKKSETKDKLQVREGDIWSLEWIYVFLVATQSQLFPSAEQKKAFLGHQYNTGVYLAASRCKVKLYVFTIGDQKHFDPHLPILRAPPENVNISSKRNALIIKENQDVSSEMTIPAFKKLRMDDSKRLSDDSKETHSVNNDEKCLPIGNSAGLSDAMDTTEPQDKDVNVIHVVEGATVAAKGPFDDKADGDDIYE